MEIIVIIAVALSVLGNYLMIRRETQKVREEVVKVNGAAEKAAALIIETAERVNARLEEKAERVASELKKDAE